MQSTILFYQFRLSVRQSVCSMLAVCVKESTYCHTFMTVWKGHHPSFLSPTIVTKVQGEPSVGGVKCTRVGEFFANIAIYHENGTRYAHSYYGTLIGSGRSIQFDLKWPNLVW